MSRPSRYTNHKSSENGHSCITQKTSHDEHTPYDHNLRIQAYPRVACGKKTRNARRRRPRADYMETASHDRFGPSDLTMIIRQSSNAPAHTCRAQNSTGRYETDHKAHTEYSAFPTGRMAASGRTNSTPAHDTQTTSHTHILVHRAQNKNVSKIPAYISQSFSDCRMRLLHEFRINKEVARRPV